MLGGSLAQVQPVLVHGTDAVPCPAAAVLLLLLLGPSCVRQRCPRCCCPACLARLVLRHQLLRRLHVGLAQQLQHLQAGAVGGTAGLRHTYQSPD